MARDFCTLQTVPHPFSLSFGGSADSVVQQRASITVVWADGTTEPHPITPTMVPVPTAYGPSSFDTTLKNYLVFAVKGGSFVMLKEEDCGSATSISGLIASNWAPVRWVSGSGIDPIPQV